MTIGGTLERSREVEGAPAAPEQAILEQVEEQSVISLDSLVALMPEYSWNRIFQGVDTLARRGIIVLRRHHFDYSIFSIHYME